MFILKEVKVRQMRQLHIKEALQVPLKYELLSLKETCMYAVVKQNIGRNLLPLDLAVTHQSSQTHPLKGRN